MKVKTFGATLVHELPMESVDTIDVDILINNILKKMMLLSLFFFPLHIAP
jgi:hypothetical protein